MILTTVFQSQRFSLSTSERQQTLFVQCPSEALRVERDDAVRFTHECQELLRFFCHVEVLREFCMNHVGEESSASIEEIKRMLPSLIALRYPDDKGTRPKLTKHLKQFLSFLIAEGYFELKDITSVVVSDFIWSAVKRGTFTEPSSATAANRQWAVRVFFQVLRSVGLWDGPDLSGKSIKRDFRESARPISDEQIETLQAMSRGLLLTNGDEVLVALSLSGGSPREIAQVHLQDIDFDRETISFRGESERVNALDAWAKATLSALSTSQVGPSPIAVRAGLALEGAAQSVTVRLNRIVGNAGLSKFRGISGASIRLGAARRILEAQGLEEAARFLGNDSLDLTARSLDYKWWEKA